MLFQNKNKKTCVGGGVAVCVIGNGGVLCASECTCVRVCKRVCARACVYIEIAPLLSARSSARLLIPSYIIVSAA